MLTDKRKAVTHQYRIPESVLLSVALCGGSMGAYVAMHLFRHKTRKPLFSIGLPILISLQAVLYIMLYLILVII